MSHSQASSSREEKAVEEDEDGPTLAHIGVSKVDVFNKVLYSSGKAGRILLWLLAISIGLTMFVYALDQGSTTTIFSAWASSAFGKHSDLAAVTTASQIIRAISKPFIGKLADITSRPTTYVVILLFYLVGFVVAASAQTFAAYTVGVAFTAVGKSGLDLLSDILVGDLTPLEWRGFFGALLSVPFIVTVPINGFISDGLKDNWRWGMGMFAIMVPVLLAPAIVTLYYMQHKGKKLGMVTMAGSRKERNDSYGRSIYNGMVEIDVIGLVLLGFAFALILLPFSLAKNAAGGWSNPSMIAMIVMGFVCLIIFALYECLLAPQPLMRRDFLRNRAFMTAVAIDIFSQMSSSVRNVYFYSYISVIKPWATYAIVIFIGTTTMGLCILGPFTGLIQRYTHRYKTLMVIGAVGKLVGYGILIVAGSNLMTNNTARLIVSQLFFCVSSFSVVGVRVGSQASVPHEDLATILSLLALWSTLGSSVGSAIVSSIWSQLMRDRLAYELPTLPAATITKMYGSYSVIQAYPFDSPTRQGAIRAYQWVMGRVGICALVLAALPVGLSLLMPNYYLGRQQNAVTNKGLDGEDVFVPTQQASTSNKWYGRLRDAYMK